jgi:hypothetical protein
VNEHLAKASLDGGRRSAGHTPYCRERPKPLHTIRAHPTTENTEWPEVCDRTSQCSRQIGLAYESILGSGVIPEHWPKRGS